MSIAELAEAVERLDDLDAAGRRRCVVSSTTITTLDTLQRSGPMRISDLARPRGDDPAGDDQPGQPPRGSRPCRARSPTRLTAGRRWSGSPTPADGCSPSAAAARTEVLQDRLRELSPQHRAALLAAAPAMAALTDTETAARAPVPTPEFLHALTRTSSASPFQQPKAVWAVAFACVISFMGIGLVDPILASLRDKLHATPSQVELLFTSYLVVTAVAMLVTGWVSSRIGAKRTLITGLVLIVVFAALAGSSGGIGGIVGFRAGWGLGNALFIATSLAVIVSSASGGFAGAIILYETALGVGIAMGPLLGGELGSISWRGPFYGVSVLMAIALVATVVLLPKTPAPRRRGEHHRTAQGAAAPQPRHDQRASGCSTTGASSPCSATRRS